MEELLDTPKDSVELLPGSPNLLALPTFADGVSTSPVRDKKDKHELRLLFFGHGCPRKGLDILLQTLSENEWPDHIHLVVAGEEVLRGVSSDLLARARKAIRLTLINRYIAPKEVTALFRDADLLLMPYIKICKSPLLDLAAALQLPVLRSDRVQGADFRDGQHGVTFSHSDPGAIGELLQDTGWLAGVNRNLVVAEDVVDTMDRLAVGHKQLYLALSEEASEPLECGPYSDPIRC